jgi:hypothetical protein
MVFGAIIRGVLKFDGFPAALELCEHMGKEGWRLCMSGLAPLLKDCAARNDLAAGLAIWEQIQERRAARVRRTFHRKPIVIQIDTYTSMLRLCSRSNQQDLFAQILDQAKNEHDISYADLTVLVKNALSDPVTFNYADGVESNKFTESGIYDDDLAGPPTVAINNSIKAEPPPPPSPSGHALRRQRSQENVSTSVPQRQQRRPQKQVHLQPISSAEYATLVNTPLPQPTRSPTRTTLFSNETLPGENDPSSFDTLATETNETVPPPSEADSPMQPDPPVDTETFAQLNLLDKSLPSPSAEKVEEVPPPPAARRFTIRPTYTEDLFTRPPSFLSSWYDDRRQHYGRLRTEDG